jgi:uncharacterized protein YjbI with pentapeptide repeats
VPERVPDVDSSDLRADCAHCFALCCVALPFAASADFAITKSAGEPCTHLQADFRCGIHDRLRERGFPGCTAYDCFGAGQKVSQVTLGGRDWRTAPQTATQMFAAFPVVRQLHELLWYVTEALVRPAADSLEVALREALDATEHLTRLPPDELLALDVAAHRQSVNTLLLAASELVRAEGGRAAAQHRGADLMGARLRGADLRGADLRGAYLIGADLREPVPHAVPARRSEGRCAHQGRSAVDSAGPLALGGQVAVGRGRDLAHRGPSRVHDGHASVVAHRSTGRTLT